MDDEILKDDDNLELPEEDEEEDEILGETIKDPLIEEETESLDELEEDELEEDDEPFDDTYDQ